METIINNEITITIKLDVSSKDVVGTFAWVSSKLEEISATLKSSHTPGGVPCLVYNHPTNQDKAGNPMSYILAIPACESSEGFANDYTYMPNINMYVTKAYGRKGMFSYLNARAEEIVDEFIVKSATLFSAILEEE
jgi:hypothetical protein